MAATLKVFVDNLPGDPNNLVEAVDMNGLKNENNNLISSTGVALNTSDNEQSTDAVSVYAAGGDFYSDSGVADAYVLSVVGSKRSPQAYFVGMRIRFLPGNTNTGASTVNVDTIGVINIKLQDGIADPNAGDIVADHELVLVFDGTNFVYENASVASQADMETPTSNTKFVSPLVAKNHPGTAKAWIIFDGTGVISILDSYNVSSIVDDGVGRYTINFTVAFSSINYSVAITLGDVSPGVFTLDDFASFTSQATSSIQIRTEDNTGAGSSPADADRVCVQFFGDQ